MKNQEIQKSSLELINLYFEKIEFLNIKYAEPKNVKDNNTKTGNDDVKFSLRSKISTDSDEKLYKVTLSITGEKENHFTFEVSVVGIFAFNENENITDRLKETLITKNTLSILMPYLRSQVSLITAQPDMECIVLPPFNINSLV